MNPRSATATKIVGALVAVLVLALGWLLALGPRTDELARAQEEVVTVQEQGAELQRRVTRLLRSRDDLGPTRKVAARLAAQFPPTADQPGLFEEITRAAVSAGIGADGVTDLSPGAPALGAGDPGAEGVGVGAGPGSDQVARQEVTVVVEGSYDQTVELLRNIEQMDRAYLVASVTVREEEPGYATTVTGGMYVMRPVPEP